MPVGIVSDSWTGTRWPPSHVANRLPVAPSAESPVPAAGCMLSDQGCCALWNVGGAMAGRQVVSRDCGGLLLADVPSVPSVLAALRMAGVGERVLCQRGVLAWVSRC